MNGVAAALSLDGHPVNADRWTFADVLGKPFCSRSPEGDFVVLHNGAVLPDRTCVVSVRMPPVVAGRWIFAAEVRLDARSDLVHALALPPSEAAGMSDEVLVGKAFTRWGENTPEKILGGFALVVWDREERRLFLAVDSTGEKKIYFHRDAHNVLVATHGATLLAAPSVSRAVDIQALLRFYTDMGEPWRTTLAGIEALPPGHSIVFDAKGRAWRRRWWSPPITFPWVRRNGDSVAQFLAIFGAAVADRLPNTGIAGGFCSGGLDSTAVSAMAARILTARSARYRTYTSVPHPDWHEASASPFWENDERSYVRALAKLHHNLDTTFVAIDGTIFLDCLPTVFAGSAGPVRNTAAMPWLFAIHDLMRADGIELPLNGDSGNATISLDHDVLVDLLVAGRLDLLCLELRTDSKEFVASIRRSLSGITPLWLKHAIGRRPPLRENSWRQRVALNPAAARIYLIDQARSHLPLTLGGVRRMHRNLAEVAWLLPSEAGFPALDPTQDRRVVECVGRCRRRNSAMVAKHAGSSAVPWPVWYPTKSVCVPLAAPKPLTYFSI